MESSGKVDQEGPSTCNCTGSQATATLSPMNELMKKQSSQPRAPQATLGFSPQSSAKSYPSAFPHSVKKITRS